MTIDLHMHSTASDGALSPTELIRFAAECGCNTVALTDHDTAAGVSEARSEAHRLGIRFIAGIEVSSLWGGRSIHVVGLGIDDTNPVLTRKVREFEVSRTRRAAQIAEKLAALGIAGMLEKATAFAENKLNVSRVHFALALLEAGAVKNQQEAFDRYLGDGKPAYIMAPWPTVAEAVDLIHTAGGIAVMAHPGRYHFKNDWTVDELMKDFAAGYADMEENAKEIRKVFDDTGYLIDTHTGVAAAVYEQYKAKTGDTTKTVIASTASPYKFSRSVMEAVLGKKKDADEFALIDEMERISGVKIPQAIEEIRDAKILHNRQCKPEEMEETVKQTFSK